MSLRAAGVARDGGRLKKRQSRRRAEPKADERVFTPMNPE
jgi:hypothetical protein